MKLLLVPTLLVMAAVAQIVRIERVTASETSAADSQALVEDTSRHAGRPLSQEKIDFDRLAEEFENFARTTYVIEPPDVVSIRILHRFSGPEEWSGMLTDVKRPQLKITEGVDQNTRGYLVDMDGYVRLNAVHWVRIAGMTVKEAQAAIKSKYQSQADEVDVRLAVAEFNSKIAYLILQDDQGKGHVIRTPLPYPFSSKMNVGALLKSAKYPNPIDFATAKISVVRPAPQGVSVELKLPVTWDVARGTPAATSNYPLLPGDRIFVAIPGDREPRGVREAPILDPPPSPVTPATPVDETKLQRSSALEIDLTVIEDSADTMAEFRNGYADMTFADAKTFRAALRALEKNGLVNVSSQERLRCELGEKTKAAVVAPIPNPAKTKPFRTADSTEVSVKPLGEELLAVKIQFKRMVDGNEVRESIEFAMRPGETNVLECTGATAASESQPPRKTYLAITATPLL